MEHISVIFRRNLINLYISENLIKFLNRGLIFSKKKENENVLRLMAPIIFSYLTLIVVQNHEFYFQNKTKRYEP